MLFDNAPLIFCELEKRSCSQCMEWQDMRGACSWHRPRLNNKEAASQLSDTWWCAVQLSYGGPKRLAFTNPAYIFSIYMSTEHVKTICLIDVNSSVFFPFDRTCFDSEKSFNGILVKMTLSWFISLAQWCARGLIQMFISSSSSASSSSSFSLQVLLCMQMIVKVTRVCYIVLCYAVLCCMVCYILCVLETCWVIQTSAWTLTRKWNSWMNDGRWCSGLVCIVVCVCVCMVCVSVCLCVCVCACERDREIR